jgi:hypothetical protein
MAGLEIGESDFGTTPEQERNLRLVQGGEEEPAERLVERDIFSRHLGKEMLAHLREEAPKPGAAGSYESPDQ